MTYYFDIARLLILATTPLLVVAIGFWLNQRLKAIEQLHWANQKVIEKRIDFYFLTTSKLNRLMCYWTYIGKWKEYTPPEIIGLKRELDEEWNIYAPLLPPSVSENYQYFMSTIFETFTGWGENAKIKGDFKKHKEALKQEWQSEWEEMFLPEFVIDPKQVQTVYTQLIAELSGSLGINVESKQFMPPRIPRKHHIMNG